MHCYQTHLHNLLHVCFGTLSLLNPKTWYLSNLVFLFPLEHQCILNNNWMLRPHIIADRLLSICSLANVINNEFNTNNFFFLKKLNFLKFHILVIASAELYIKTKCYLWKDFFSLILKRNSINNFLDFFYLLLINKSEIFLNLQIYQVQLPIML